MTTVKDPEGNEEKIIHQFVDFRGKQVLEVGCGDGRMTWKYAASTQRTTGFDLEMADLRLARADHPSSAENKVAFAQASALSIPFQREAFDVVLLGWSL